MFWIILSKLRKLLGCLTPISESILKPIPKKDESTYHFVSKKLFLPHSSNCVRSRWCSPLMTLRSGAPVHQSWYERGSDHASYRTPHQCERCSFFESIEKHAPIKRFLASAKHVFTVRAEVSKLGKSPVRVTAGDAVRCNCWLSTRQVRNETIIVSLGCRKLKIVARPIRPVLFTKTGEHLFQLTA